MRINSTLLCVERPLGFCECGYRCHMFTLFLWGVALYVLLNWSGSVALFSTSPKWCSTYD